MNEKKKNQQQQRPRRRHEMKCSGNERLTFKYELSLKMQWLDHTNTERGRGRERQTAAMQTENYLWCACPLSLNSHLDIKSVNNRATDYLQRIMGCARIYSNMRTTTAKTTSVLLHAAPDFNAFIYTIEKVSEAKTIFTFCLPRRERLRRKFYRFKCDLTFISHNFNSLSGKKKTFGWARHDEKWKIPLHSFKWASMLLMMDSLRKWGENKYSINNSAADGFLWIFFLYFVKCYILFFFLFGFGNFWTQE